MSLLTLLPSTKKTHNRRDRAPWKSTQNQTAYYQFQILRVNLWRGPDDLAFVDRARAKR